MGIRGTVNADSAFHPAMENREDKGLEVPQDVATREKAALGVQTDPVKHAEVQETAGEGGEKAESPEAVTKYDVGVGVSDGDQPVGVVTVEGKEEGPSCTCPKEGPRTSEYYQIRNKVPKRFDHPDWFVGYGASEAKNPFYQTSAASIGGKPPSVHTMPTQFNGRSQKFTGRLAPYGMYRNHSLNTEVDKSRVLKYHNFPIDTNLEC